MEQSDPILCCLTFSLGRWWIGGDTCTHVHLSHIFAKKELKSYIILLLSPFDILIFLDFCEDLFSFSRNIVFCQGPVLFPCMSAGPGRWGPGSHVW